MYPGRGNHMKRLLIALSLVLCGAIAVPALAGDGHKGKRGKHRGNGPSVISIPNGFQPEGITIYDRDRFLVSSRATGAIYEGGTGRGATGIKVDRRDRLFVSGARTKVIRIYDVDSGEELKTYDVPQSLFINDVTLTRQGAYFTDSLRPFLYFIPFERNGELGELEEIALGGDWVQNPGVNNANGIAATRDGDTLIMVKSNTGEAFAVDAVEEGTATARRIAVTGGDGELVNTDGILLLGRTLFATENRDADVPEGIGEVSAVKLSRDLTSGRIVKEIHDEDFEVPSTIAASKRGLYVVNAKFNIAAPTADTPYEVVRVPSGKRGKGHDRDDD